MSMKKLLLLLVALNCLLWAYNANAAIAFFKYEVVTGQTKQCVYENFKGTFTITLKAHQLCPLSIQR